MRTAATIPQLGFEVLGAERLEHAAVPTVRFALCVRSAPEEDIRSVLLDVQVQIAARRRHYDEAAFARLSELFGPPAGWGTGLHTLLWARTTLVVPPFTASTVVELPLPCTYDTEVAAAKYLDALRDGDVPLEFLFSGTVLFASETGQLQATRISWEEEAEYRMPVRIWRETMDRYFPGTAWLRLPRESYDKLCDYKARRALASWEETVDALLREA